MQPILPRHQRLRDLRDWQLIQNLLDIKPTFMVSKRMTKYSELFYWKNERKKVFSQVSVFQFRLIQVRLGQVRRGQVRLDQARLGQVDLFQSRLSQVRSGQFIFVQVKLVQVRLGSLDFLLNPTLPYPTPKYYKIFHDRAPMLQDYLLKFIRRFVFFDG